MIFHDGFHCIRAMGRVVRCNMKGLRFLCVECPKVPDTVVEV